MIWLVGLAAAAASVPLLALDARARVLAGNTLLLAGATAALSVMFGAPVAFLLARTEIPLRRSATVLLLALLFTPLYLQAAAWQAGFGLQGWYTLAVGGPALLGGWSGAILVHVAAAIPWVVVIVGLGLRLAEPELEEEALLDATPGQVFRRVTLRRTTECVAAAFLWVAVATAGEMTVTDLFLIRTYAEEIYTQFALGDTLETATWNLIPSAVAIAWVIVGGLLLTSRLVPLDRHTSQRAARNFRLGGWRIPATALVWAIVGLLFLIPAASLVIKAGRIVTRSTEGLVRGWSAEQCLTMTLGSPLRFPREFGWTLVIGAVAATAALVVGLALAWSARRGGWRAAPAWLTIAICLALPGPLVGLALIELLDSPAVPWLAWLYDHSILAIAIVQTIRALPLATLVLWYALRTISPELLTSATLDGAGPLARFFRIALPQRGGALAAAWLVALAMASGELAGSILVVPPGVVTLPIQIFGLIHFGVDDQVAGVSLFIFGLFLATAAIVALLARFSAGRR